MYVDKSEFGTSCIQYFNYFYRTLNFKIREKFYFQNLYFFSQIISKIEYTLEFEVDPPEGEPVNSQYIQKN